MATSRRVTQEEVDAVANRLIADGVDPTVISVREAVGGRGSYSTIGAMLAKWRQTAAEKATPGAKASLPDPIAQAVAAFIEEQVQGIKKATDAWRAEEERARANAERTVDTLEERGLQLAAEIEQLRNEREQIRGRAERLQEELATQRAELKTLEQRAHEAERGLAAAVAKLEGAVARAEAAEEREKEARAAARDLRQTPGASTDANV